MNKRTTLFSCLMSGTFLLIYYIKKYQCAVHDRLFLADYKNSSALIWHSAPSECLNPNNVLIQTTVIVKNYFLRLKYYRKPILGALSYFCIESSGKRV